MSSTPRQGFNLKASAIKQLEQGVFPNHWSLIPVAGKETYIQGWSKGELDRRRCVEAYKTNRAYNGIGVLTGEASGGLLALDIDGPLADARYRAAAGDQYEAHGNESTMSWTSGRPGRRQIMFQVPSSVVPELRHVKTLILRGDGTWHLGHSDVDRQAARLREKEAGEAQAAEEGPAYEEVVLRFNQCQSVLPGSKHPETKSHYEWLNYNDCQVAPAPGWVMDVLRGFRKPVQWLSEKDQENFNREVAATAIPPNQIRGWFFKEEVQRLLRPRLEDLVFNHPTFDQYGWKERAGENPQRMSGCPWHGGISGTAFQYSVETGCWDCKACGVGGDVLDFRHKIETSDLYAGRPSGADLERYVAEIAEELGFNYPEDAKVQVTKEKTGLRLDRRQLLTEAKRLIREIRNPAEQDLALMDLADRSGLYRLTAVELKRLAQRDSLYGSTQSAGLRQEHGWSDLVDQEDYIIPGLLLRPSQVMLHARGGVGKSEMALALAKAVGRGETLKIRGLDVPCKQGRVLWFSNDQGNSRLASMLRLQGIEENGRDKNWFELVTGWKLDMHEEFKELIYEHQPTLCVMDSLGTIMEDIAKENEGDYAKWIYQLTSLNGDTSKEAGFPAVAIIWIHHNTKDNATFRGSDRLLNAMEETWSLRELTEEEEAELGVNRRILTIGKSRFNRGGDRLIVHRDLEFNFSISDMTPLIQKEGVNRTGDSTPESLVLAILAASEEPLCRERLLKELHDRMRGEGRKEKELPSDWGLRKYLSIWRTSGLVDEVKLPSTGGRPRVGYVSRGKDTCLSHRKPEDDRELFQRNGFGLTRLSGEALRKSPSEGSLTESPEHWSGETQPDCGGVNSSPNPVEGLSVGGSSEGGAHRKSAPTDVGAASDLGVSDFLCGADVSFLKEPPTEPARETHGQSPLPAGGPDLEARAGVLAAEALMTPGDDLDGAGQRTPCPGSEWVDEPEQWGAEFGF